MRITLSSIFVTDQEKAQKFYCDALGFITKHDIPVGDYKWLTVVSPEDPEGTELLLEPDASDIAKKYMTALKEQGIPAHQFTVNSVDDEYTKLVDKGVNFLQEPTQSDSVRTAIFDDTVGNYIQLVSEQ